MTPLAVRKLRPAKVRSGVRRRWFSWQLSRLTPTASEGAFVDVGTPYGGWIVPEGVGSDWTCYCVGIGGDTSLERHLLSRGATVRSFEPVQRFVDEANAELGATGRFTADCVAIAPTAGTLRMQKHHESASSSLSAAHLYESNETVDVPAVTLTSVMQRYADARIDFLKLDVEGLEYELVPELDLRGLRVRFFAIQLHHNGSLRDARRLIDHLQARGYRYVGQRLVLKLTFAFQ